MKTKHFPFLFLLTVLLVSCTSEIITEPILILATNAGYGTYTAELLKTEGFNEYRIDSLSDPGLTLKRLKRFDRIILAEANCNSRIAKRLTRYVKSGGSLIAFCPDTLLATLFGISPVSGLFNEGYLRIDTATGQGHGLPANLLRLHGRFKQYTLTNGYLIASLIPGKDSDKAFPGVVSHEYGKGHAIAFLYNLPQDIVYTRQGNPLWAGREKDGIPGIRGMDLFTGGWVDTAENTLNQADVQMSLLSHCLETSTQHTDPLPRFWYFPDTLKCLVTLTNDGEFKGESDFEPQFHDVDSMGAKMSLYVLEVNKISRAWTSKWTQKGFEIAGHPDDTRHAARPGWNNMDSALWVRKKELATLFDLPMKTNVNHWFVWCGLDSSGKPDFGAEARLEEKNGIELDANYAHYDMQSNQGDHYLGPLGYRQGNFTGSGMVMKYADIQGRTTGVYQHFNAVYDQEYMECHDPEGFYECFRGLVDRSLQKEAYSFICIKSHNDEYYFSKEPLMKMLAYANLHDIPVWTEQQLLGFLKTKDQAAFRSISWKNRKLTFHIPPTRGYEASVTVMLPVTQKQLSIQSISVNQKDHKIMLKWVKGKKYAFIPVTLGPEYRISAIYE